MCGLFAFFGNTPDDVVDLRALKEIACVTERRGPHSFGFAYVDSYDRLRHYKQTGRISDHLHAMDRLVDAHVVIGHCRWATQGDYANNLNNHPFSVDGGWLVHNGRVDNYQELLSDWDLHPVTDCDSEAIALMMEDIVDAKRIERAACAVNAVKSIRGREPGCNVMALWRDQLVVVRRDKPLSASMTDRGTYFASLQPKLPGTVATFTNRHAMSMSYTKRGKLSVRRISLDACELV